jgi:hypothetical protein
MNGTFTLLYEQNVVRATERLQVNKVNTGIVT